MNPVSASEIKSMADYELARDEFRKQIMAVKRPRRIAVGENITVLFENHETVLYQIQEMLRVEGITDPKAIRHEIETYNELIPGPDALSATLLVEYAEPAERDVKLRELLGLENHLALEVDGVGESRAQFDLRQMGTDRVSAVHYIGFELGKKMADGIRAGAPVRMRVDHSKLQAVVELSAEQTTALKHDLAF